MATPRAVALLVDRGVEIRSMQAMYGDSDLPGLKGFQPVLAVDWLVCHVPGVRSSLAVQLLSGDWVSLDSRVPVDAMVSRGRLLTQLPGVVRVTNSAGRRHRGDQGASASASVEPISSYV